MHAALLSLAVSLMGNGAPVQKYRPFLAREVRFVWGMDEPVSTFAAQIFQESGFDENARSAHAGGLAQFTPATQRWIEGAYPELAQGGMFDWKWSIRALVRYDRHLHRRLPDDARRWRLTLRAYNGGLGWIQKELGACGAADAACCRRFRAESSCRENLAYPALILDRWKPQFAGWDR